MKKIQKSHPPSIVQQQLPFQHWILIMFYRGNHTTVSSFTENLSQADFKETTYILMDNLSLVIYLF